MQNRIMGLSSFLLEFLFVENCRLCKSLIAPGSSPAQTVCVSCWEPIFNQESRLDSCSIAGHGELKVAYAAVYENKIKTLIHKLKYKNDRLIAKDLGLLLSKTLNSIESPAPGTMPASPHKTVFLPVPLSRLRKLQRGFNQAELLAHSAAEFFPAKVNHKLLLRKKHTVAQHSLGRAERQENLRDAFCLSTKTESEASTLFVLVDDIHTSGATLAEAARTLFDSGARNLAAVTVARALLN